MKRQIQISRGLRKAVLVTKVISGNTVTLIGRLSRITMNM